MENVLKEKKWWNYLEEDLQELFSESFLLRKLFAEKVKVEKSEEFHDYSFIVFPAAKAFEGFLKKLFLDCKFITEADYFGRHFRIGKALNPFLPNDLEKESVYKKLTEYSGNDKLSSTLWNAWKSSRNLVFHWFPEEKNALSFEEAGHAIEEIISAIDVAYAELSSKEGSTLD